MRHEQRSTSPGAGAPKPAPPASPPVERSAGAEPGMLAAAPGLVPLGKFSRERNGDHWTWSPEVYAILGFTPGETEPGMDVALSRVHPDDREGVAAVFAEHAQQTGPYALFHRIIDVGGQTRHILSCGHCVLDEDGNPVRDEGYFLDLTSRRREESRLDIEEAIARVTERRAEIEQAKGALMALFGLDADAAFAALALYSQRANLKVRDVAVQVVAAATAGGADRSDLTDLLTAIAGERHVARGA